MAGLSKTFGVVLAAAVWVWPMPAWGQARSRYRWRTPRTPGVFHIVGGDLGIYGSSSSGLRRVTPTGTGDLLRSSISRAANYDVSRKGYGSGAPSSLAGKVTPKGLSAPTGMSYKPITVEVNVPAAGAAKLSPWAGVRPLPAVSSAAITGVGDALKPGEGKPVTSFVPPEPSFYQQRMERGEKDFRAGRYREALSWFKVAASVVRHSPESHLSRTHALFAVSEYHQASYHLQKALEYFPELPLARLEIRKFYGKQRQEDFDKHLRALEEEVDRRTVTADEPLVLAYVRYFSGETDQAASALRRAHTISVLRKDKAAKEAVEVFWDAMLAGGKVSGSLGPTSRPASRPAKARAPEKKSGTGAAARSSGSSPEDRAGQAGGDKPTSTPKPTGQ